MPFCSYRLKPPDSTARLYIPTGSNGNTKPPFEPVTASRVRPVALLVTPILAPTTAAPLGSRTVPAIVPVGSAALATKHSRIHRTAQERLFMSHTPIIR